MSAWLFSPPHVVTEESKGARQGMHKHVDYMKILKTTTTTTIKEKLLKQLTSTITTKAEDMGDDQAKYTVTTKTKHTIYRQTVVKVQTLAAVTKTHRCV